MQALRFVIFVVFILLSALSSSAQSLSGCSPQSGPVGTVVTITGSGFGATQASNSSVVFYSGVTATPTTWSDTQIVVSVPAGATTGGLYIYINGQSLGGFWFQVGTPPVVTSWSPSYGTVGTVVTLNGNHFGTTQGSSSVTFNGVSAPITSWSDTQIVASVPTGATTGGLYVWVNGLSGGGIWFQVGVAPEIDSYSPSTGPVGTAVTINGQHFGATQGSSTVTFNGTSAPITTWSDTQIVASVPTGATTGSLYVNASGFTSNGGWFQVGVAPEIDSFSPGSGPVGTIVTINGLHFGTTQGSSTVIFNGVAATATSWSDTQVIVSVPAGASTGALTLTVNGLYASYWFTVTQPQPPQISSITPSAASIGTSVIIAGSNFGSSQGSSTVTFNNVSASPSLWSDTQIAVPVPPGATTGNVVVQVGGQFSSGFAFTVVAPPSVSAYISPSPNANGWYNSNVLVSFNCSASSFLVSISTCAAPQLVTTEGANQQITGTGTDSSGDVGSTSVLLNIDKTAPTLSVSSPADGDTESSSALTVTGSSADALSGLSSVSCNGTPVTVTSGNFTCNISLNAGVNLVMVTAMDNAGNVGGLRLHVNYATALPAPTSLQITPANANVLVGATQQFTAIDQLGHPRTDATWTVSDTTIATISTDASPILTGVAAGQVTLTASVGSVTAQVQITVLSGSSLPVGTALWTAPAVSGFTTKQIVQAVPTSNGTPDLYSIEQDSSNNTLVRAFTGDGQQLWQTTLSSNQVGSPLPQMMGDAFGGLLIGGLDLDGQTGTVAFNSPYGASAVGQDGSIYAAGLDPATNSGAIFKTDPNSGGTTEIFAAPLGVSSSSESNVPTRCNHGTGSYATPGSITSSIVIDADGTVFFGYQTGQSNSSYAKYCLGNEPTDIDTARSITSGLAAITSNGVTTTQTGIDTASFVANVYPATGGTTTSTLSGGSVTNLTPDGNGGALYTYADANSHTVMMASSSTGASYPAPLGGGSWVLGENGNAFITDGTSVASFQTNAGLTNWLYGSANGVEAMNAISGGGVTVTDNGSNLIPIDDQGNPDAGVPGVSSASPGLFGSATWLGLRNGQLLLFAGPSSDLASSFWPTSAGEPQNQNTASPTASITVNFTGYKSQGDHLNFSGAGGCSEDLGLWTCPFESWTFYVEGVATVSDDASRWKVRQDAVILRSGKTKDAQGILHDASDSLNTRSIPGSDDPCVLNDPRLGCTGIVSVQQPSGQNTIFWLDHPGSLYQASEDAVWDSLTETGQFTSAACNRFGVCAKVKWFIKLVVDPGSNLNCAQSLDGLLSQPITCP